jgi:hypothetical protein
MNIENRSFGSWVGLIAGAITVVGLTGAGCRTHSSSQPTSRSAPDANGSAPAPTVVTVTGSETVAKLGDVAPDSTHIVVFVIANSRDQVVQIRKVRSDCSCTTVVDPPTKIDPHGTARVTLRYQAPPTVMAYEDRVLVQTDDPDRKLIWLVVQSRTVAP